IDRVVRNHPARTGDVEIGLVARPKVMRGKIADNYNRILRARLSRHAPRAQSDGGELAGAAGQRAVLEPGQGITMLMTVARFDRPGGLPEGDDIVVNLIIGADLDQGDGALTPILPRDDPGAGATVVEYAIILILLKIPFALHQAKPFDRGRAERVHHRMGRDVQRP